MPIGTTTYSPANNFPLDGNYTVFNGTFGNGFDWHQTQDHTPSDINGKCLIVNVATASAGEFYQTTISGLCPNTTYEFSAWLINLVRANSFCSSQPGGTIPINVRFEIRNNTDTANLASGNTGNIVETVTPTWNEYGLVFKTGSETSIILKMINNGIGGCGNDLAIDDIEFKSCGDFVTVSDSSNNNSASLCSTQAPYATTLTAYPDFTVYSSHFYQWENSSDGIIWNDIIGKTNQTISISTTNTRYYRTKIAEFSANLSNPQCVSFSNEYRVTINQLPTMPTLACWQTTTINNTTCSWDITGTQPKQQAIACWETPMFNNTSCSWEVTGTQPTQPIIACYETTTFNTTSCSWDVTGTQPSVIIEKNITFCEDNNVTLEAQTNISNPSYLWDNGDIIDELTVDTSGLYSVEISGDFCSFETIVFNVIEIENPIIETVVSDENDIIITTTNTGDFLYSIDGTIFQSGDTFSNVEGGPYTVFVKEINCNNPASIQHLHFFIPKYFTPNNDGINDTFSLAGIEFYPSSEVSIFNRFGKLLKHSKNSAFSWNGTFNNQDLPTNDYWCVIIIEGQKFTGSFTLKR